MNTPVKLTQLTKSGGCGCKISPSALREILSHSDSDLPVFDKLLVGNADNDDAAVMELENGDLLISTVDFFMPVVDDAYDFGCVAAANALSDVYAMGGKPLMALAILGWPVASLSLEEANRVMQGARFICTMAGIPLAGGHSVEAAEPFFGLSVNGLVKKGNLKKNNTPQDGDYLYLTKPIGAGVLAAAMKRGISTPADDEALLGYMKTLNRIGERLGEMEAVTALTDVTGFGLAGHLLEMLGDTGLSAELDFAAIPKYPGLKKYLDAFVYPDMTTKNFSAYSSRITSLSAEQLFTLCDPQTSGGLLVAVRPESRNDFEELALNHGLMGIADHPIGRIIGNATHPIVVV
jgi:selenide,water dikinase